VARVVAAVLQMLMETAVVVLVDLEPAPVYP
jgi:hypothetical protein